MRFESSLGGGEREAKCTPGGGDSFLAEGIASAKALMWDMAATARRPAQLEWME